MTKSEFLLAYRDALSASQPWAADTVKLDRFMRSVARTIGTRALTETPTGESTQWGYESDIARGLFQARMRGVRYTLKALRALEA